MRKLHQDLSGSPGATAASGLRGDSASAGPLSRRQALLRGAGFAAGTAGISTMLAACGGSGAKSGNPTAAGGAGKVAGTATLLTYPEWYASGLIKQFERRYPDASIKLVNADYSSLTAVAQRVIRDPSSYDMVLTGSAVVLLDKAGVIAPVDESIIPNLKLIEDQYRKEYPWGVPLEGIINGLAYSGDKVSEKLATWADVWKVAPKYKDRIVMSGVAEVALSIALLYLGYPLDATLDEDKISKAADSLIELKPYIQAFKETGLSQTLLDGSADMVIGAFNSETAGAQLKNPGIKYVNPEEGVPGFLEGWVMIKDGGNLEVAAALANEQLDPKTYARFVTEKDQAWLIPAAEKYLDAKRLKAKAAFTIPKQYAAKYVSDPKINLLYTKYWQKVRAA